MRIGEGIVVFVTGGASGLGESTVRYLHAMGASVAVADMNVELMQKLHATLQERILCVPCDVTKEEDVKNAIDKTVKTFGTVHVALACAGVNWGSLTLTSKSSLNTK